MFFGLVNFSEMRQIEGSGRMGFYKGNGFFPIFYMDVRRGAGRNYRALIDFYPSYIPGKYQIAQLPGNMMDSMSGRVKGFDFHFSKTKDLTIRCLLKLLFRDGSHFSPESLHVLPINLSCRVPQPFWGRQMWQAQGVYMYNGTGLRQFPGRTGMVKVDVGKQNMFYIAYLIAQLIYPFLKLRPSALRPRFDQNWAFPGFN